MGAVSITAVKRELYDDLKDMKEVVGAGIKGEGASEYIVIFVTSLSAKIKSSIPEKYKGIRIKLEKRSVAKIL